MWNSSTCFYDKVRKQAEEIRVESKRASWGHQSTENSGIKKIKWGLPDVIVIPDKQEMLKDWQEVGLRACVFHHIGQEMVHFIHISTEAGLKKTSSWEFWGDFGFQLN